MTIPVQPVSSAVGGGKTRSPEWLIVIPTYNEVGNVHPLILQLEPVRATVGLDVLFVDDGSPDGTADAIRELSLDRGWIHLLERERPLGLGSAYRDGFSWGLARGYSGVGEMDADLSHDPALLPTLVDALLTGSDLAIASRYVPGGGSEGWPLSRRLLSRTANMFARTVLRLRTHDTTSGYRLYGAHAAALILDAGTQCDGYGFQIEGVCLIERAGGNVSESPLVFVDRSWGESKMNRTIAWEAAKRCFALAVRPPAVPSLSDAHGASMATPGLRSETGLAGAE